MKPFTGWSTEDPPIQVENLLLREYIYGLRRRIEVQGLLAEALTEELARLRTQQAGAEETG